jgi:hypothetical protein
MKSTSFLLTGLVFLCLKNRCNAQLEAFKTDDRFIQPIIYLSPKWIYSDAAVLNAKNTIDASISKKLRLHIELKKDPDMVMLTQEKADEQVKNENALATKKHNEIMTGSLAISDRYELSDLSLPFPPDDGKKESSQTNNYTDKEFVAFSGIVEEHTSLIENINTKLQPSDDLAAIVLFDQPPVSSLKLTAASTIPANDNLLEKLRHAPQTVNENSYAVSIRRNAVMRLQWSGNRITAQAAEQNEY